MKYRRYSCAFIIIITINYHKKVTEINSFRLRLMVGKLGFGCGGLLLSFLQWPGRTILLFDEVTEPVPCKLFM